MTLILLTILAIFNSITSSTPTSPTNLELIEEGLCLIKPNEIDKPDYNNIIEYLAKIKQNNEILSGIMSQIRDKIDTSINELETNAMYMFEHSLTQLVSEMNNFKTCSEISSIRLKYAIDWVNSKHGVVSEEEKTKSKLNQIKQNFEEAKNNIQKMSTDFSKVIQLSHEVSEKASIILSVLRDIKENSLYFGVIRKVNVAINMIKMLDNQ